MPGASSALAAPMCVPMLCNLWLAVPTLGGSTALTATLGLHPTAHVDQQEDGQVLAQQLWSFLSLGVYLKGRGGGRGRRGDQDMHASHCRLLSFGSTQVTGLSEESSQETAPFSQCTETSPQTAVTGSELQIAVTTFLSDGETVMVQKCA